jgi:hypothetical protein
MLKSHNLDPKIACELQASHANTQDGSSYSTHLAAILLNNIQVDLPTLASMMYNEAKSVQPVQGKVKACTLEMETALLVAFKDSEEGHGEKPLVSPPQQIHQSQLRRLSG